MVDQMLARQDRDIPINKIESFQIETAARKALAELVSHFTETQTEHSKTIKTQSQLGDRTRARVE